MLEPEFKVTRRDSLGMAAKEHTQNMMKSDKTQEMRDSVQSGIDTNGVHSNEDENRVYTEGTFAVESELPKIVENTEA